MKEMSKKTGTLYADRLIAVEYLSKIQADYRKLHIFLLQKEESNTTSNTNRIRSIATNIDSVWENYTKTFLTQEEKKIIDSTIIIKNNIDSIITGSNFSTLQTQQAKLQHDKLIENIHLIETKLNALIKLQISVGGDITRESREVSEKNETKYLSLTAILLLIIILFSYYIINDIRELIRNLETSNLQIKASEEKCIAFVKYAGDAIFILNQDFVIQEVNESACRLTGYSAEEMADKKIADFMAKKEVQDYENRVRFIRDTGSSVHERIFKRKDNIEIITEVSVKELENIGYVSIARDISERKKLEEQQLLIATIVDSTHDAIISKTLDSTITSWNNAAEQIFGYTKDEILGKSILILIPKELQDEEEKIISNIKNKISVTNFETIRIRKDGKRIWVSLTVSSVIDKNGKVIGASKIVRDITDIKQAAEDIRTSREKYFTFFKQASDGILVADMSGNITEANASICNLLGYTHKEILSLRLEHLIEPDELKAEPISYEKLWINGKVPWDL